MAWARASPSSPRSVRQKKSPRKRPVPPSPSQSLREVIRFDIRLWWRLHYRWRFRDGLRDQEQPARDQLRQAEVERALADPQRELLLAGVRAHLEQGAPEVGHREVS